MPPLLKLTFFLMVSISLWMESHIFNCLFLPLNCFFGLPYHPNQLCIFLISFLTIFLGWIFFVWIWKYLLMFMPSLSVGCRNCKWLLSRGATLAQGSAGVKAKVVTAPGKTRSVCLSVQDGWLLCSLLLGRLLPVSAYFSFSWTLMFNIDIPETGLWTAACHSPGYWLGFFALSEKQIWDN